MTKDEFRAIVASIMVETLPRIDKKDRENFLDTLVDEVEGDLLEDESNDDTPTDPDKLFDSLYEE